MIRHLHIPRKRLDEYIESLKGEYIDESYFNELIDYPANVYKPKGSLLLAHRPKMLRDRLPGMMAYDALASAARSSGHRQGKRSGTLGNYPDEGGRPKLTAPTREGLHEWRDEIVPFIQQIDRAFLDVLPDVYVAQREWIKPECRIEGTIFTTVTSNLTEDWYVHRDGNLRDSLSASTVLKSYEYGGGYVVFPAFRVAVDLQPSDILLADVNEYHAVTSFTGKAGTFERISIVCYASEKFRRDTT